MIEIIQWLQGKKSYFVALIGGLVFTCNLLGYMPDAMMWQILVALGITGVATLRAGMKSGK